MCQKPDPSITVAMYYNESVIQRENVKRGNAAYTITPKVLNATAWHGHKPEDIVSIRLRFASPH